MLSYAVQIHRSFLLSLAAALLLCGGCNLAIDVEDHPYPQPFVEPPEEDAGTVKDVETDTADASPPTKGPVLLITELMIRPSTPPGESQELGEYIEIYNAGDEPIDPRDLMIELLETNDRIYVDRLISSPEEEAVVTGLRPIEPGGYFIFLRQDDPYYEITESLEEGTYYEYGRWHRSIPLSNFSRTLRLLELRGEFQFHIHHEVGWRQGYLSDLDEISQTRLDIRENIAFGLRPDITDAVKAADPNNWCYHLQRFSDGPLLGSPGRRTPDTCL